MKNIRLNIDIKKHINKLGINKCVKINDEIDKDSELMFFESKMDFNFEYLYEIVEEVKNRVLFNVVRCGFIKGLKEIPITNDISELLEDWDVQQLDLSSFGLKGMFMFYDKYDEKPFSTNELNCGIIKSGLSMNKINFKFSGNAVILSDTPKNEIHDLLDRIYNNIKLNFYEKKA